MLFVGILLAACGTGGGGGEDQAKSTAQAVFNKIASAFGVGTNEIEKYVDTENFMHRGWSWSDIRSWLEDYFYPALNDMGYELEAHWFAENAGYSDDKLWADTLEYYFITDGTQRRFYGTWFTRTRYYLSQDEDGNWLWEGNQLDFYGGLEIRYYVRIPLDPETLQPNYGELHVREKDYNGKTYYYAKLLLDDIESATCELYGDDNFSFIALEDDTWVDEGKQITVVEKRPILIPEDQKLDSSWVKVTDSNDPTKVFYAKLLTPMKMEEITGVDDLFSIVPYLSIQTNAQGQIESIKVVLKKLQNGELVEPLPSEVPYSKIRITYEKLDGTDESCDFHWFEDENGLPYFGDAFNASKEFIWDLPSPVDPQELKEIDVNCYVGDELCVFFFFDLSR